MNTKEAIEFLKNRHKYVLNRGSALYISKTNEAIGQIIEIAECGEKYEAMWGEIATMYKLPCYGLENSKVLEIVKFLEQKYFPKEVNKSV